MKYMKPSMEILEIDEDYIATVGLSEGSDKGDSGNWDDWGN